MSVILNVSGAPVATNLNGVYYLCDESMEGNARVWRNKGSGRICFEEEYQGWVLRDVYLKQPFFVDHSTPPVDPETGEATPVVPNVNPWATVESNDTNIIQSLDTWTAIAESCTGYLVQVIVNTVESPIVEEAVGPVVVDRYALTNDLTFQATNTYYVNTGTEEIPVYHQVIQIVSATKIEPKKFFERKVATDGSVVYEFTSDLFFDSNKTYYTNPDQIPGLYIQAVYTESKIPTPNSTYYVIVGATTYQKTTIKNTYTKDEQVFENTHTVTSQDAIVQHNRYYVPDIEVGHIYRFAFVKDFRYLGYMDPTDDDWTDVANNEKDSDITRGVFRIENITTYYDVVLSGIDVYQNLYLPLGLSRDLYELDRKTWNNGDVWYKLVDPAYAPRVFYVPLSIIKGTPDANVNAYERYHLIIDIGIFKEPKFLTDLVNSINMLMKAKFGIPTTAQLASYDKLYIPDMYYNWLENQRVEAQENFMNEYGTQYYRTLFADKYNTLYQENIKLRQQVLAYENIMTGDKQ